MPQEGVRGVSSRLRLEPSERQFRFMLRHPRAVGFMVRLALLVPVRWWPERNVTLVRAMTPPDVDFAAIMRDDALWAAAAQVMTPLLHATVEVCGTILPSGDTYVGVDGFRAMALEWYAPFVSYRVEPGEGVDLGERVFVPYRCFGRVEGSTAEVEILHAIVATFRERRIARLEVYLTLDEARDAVGLAK
jgi:hypothetical protein